MADKIKPKNTSTSIEQGTEFSPDRSEGGPIKLDQGRPKTLEEMRKTGVTKGKLTTGAKKKKDNWWVTVIWAVLIAIFLRTFFIEAFRIPTGSMKNTLLVGDYLFVNKVSYAFKFPKYLPFTSTIIPHFSIKTGNIHRGDVLVFEYPGEQELVEAREKKINYIKRCIGLPGDSIQVIAKQVYVNGKAMQNPAEMVYREGANPKTQQSPDIFPTGAPWNRDWYGPIRVPKEGDIIPINRDNFSRWSVFIAREGHKPVIDAQGAVEIDGKVTGTYTVERDYLWMMGDNRDDSQDSRYWGFAPVDNVVGQALIIYFSHYSPPSSGYGDGYDPDEVQDSHFRWDRIGRLIN
jgi:signal peptidase I